MHVGERIAEMMKKKGISQNRLAKMAQLSQSGISSIISGASSPKENTLQAIASALGCSVSDLLNDEKEPEDKWDLSERLRRDPDFRIVYDQLSKAKPEHIRAVSAMLKSLEGERND